MITEHLLQDILILLHTITGHDFTRQQRPRVALCIEDRMRITGHSDLTTYSEYLRDTPEEHAALTVIILTEMPQFFLGREAAKGVELKNLASRHSHGEFPQSTSNASFSVTNHYVHIDRDHDKALRKSPRNPRYSDLHQFALNSITAPTLIVDEEHNILHMSEKAGTYLRHVGGELSCNLLTLILPEMSQEMRITLFLAQQGSTLVNARPVIITRKNLHYRIQIAAYPFQHNGTQYTVLLFQETEVSPDEIKKRTPSWRGELEPLNDITRELQLSKAHLQEVIEQFEVTRQELQSYNERMQESNVELRLANEELQIEIVKLKSINSSLLMTNDEFQKKVKAREQVTEQLTNSIASIDVAAVMIDGDRRIQWFTPRAQEIFKILPCDVGRSLLDFTHCLNYNHLARDTLRVIESLESLEFDVSCTHAHHYNAHFTPLRRNINEIKGAVLTFIETPRSHMNYQQQSQEEQLLDSATINENTQESSLHDDRRVSYASHNEHCPLVSHRRIDLANMLTDIYHRVTAPPSGIGLTLQLLDSELGPMLIDGEPKNTILSLIKSAFMAIPSGQIRLIASRDEVMDQTDVLENTGAAEPLGAGLAPLSRIDTGSAFSLLRIRQLAQVHAGSKGLGEGPAFSAHLTMCEADNPGTPPEQPGEYFGRLAGISVFLVDDSAEVLDTLKILLEAEDAEVIAFTEPMEALKAATRSRFDVMICDLNMPRMNGFELMRALRCLPHAQRVPAIALSSYGTATDVENSLLSGFDRHIHKPFSYFDMLIDTIENLRRAKLH